MSTPLPQPKKKDPQKRSVAATRPPEMLLKSGHAPYRRRCRGALGHAVLF